MNIFFFFFGGGGYIFFFQKKEWTNKDMNSGYLLEILAKLWPHGFWKNIYLNMQAIKELQNNLIRFWMVIDSCLSFIFQKFWCRIAVSTCNHSIPQLSFMAVYLVWSLASTGFVFIISANWCEIWSLQALLWFHCCHFMYHTLHSAPYQKSGGLYFWKRLQRYSWFLRWFQWTKCRAFWQIFLRLRKVPTVVFLSHTYSR